MHSPTPSTSTLPPVENHDTDKISAYYSLAFPNFTYYLQTLTVTIGRRPIPSASTSDVSLVDVDLGPLKSVSRLHARIEYEEEEERFILVVLGRNGAWVDGIWAGSGSKVPLGARSQIQIATRTFHFILPPPPEPESTTLSPPSTARQRSPSVDITSLSTASSHPGSPQPKTLGLTTPNGPPHTASKPAKSTKKRKRHEPDQPPPDKMPPKPVATYAVMCYRAITSLGGKATLHEVLQWMIDNYEWYRLNAGGPWENSVRHNLSSNRAFRSVAKSSDERGKGFVWGIDPKAEQGLRDQDAKAQQAEEDRQNGPTVPSSSSAPAPTMPKSQQPKKPVFTKEPLIKTPNAKEKNPVLPSLPKLSVNGHHHPRVVESTTTSLNGSVPTAPFASTPLPSDTPSGVSGASPVASSSVPQIPPNVTLPIIVAPLPDSHPAAASASAAALASSSPASAILTTPPIVLHAGSLILNPTIFSHLTPEQLKELEGLGAQKALEILQGHIVRFLKEKMRSEGGIRGRGRGRGRGRVGKVASKGLRDDPEQHTPGTPRSGDDVRPALEQNQEGDGPSIQRGASQSRQSLDQSLSIEDESQVNGVNMAVEGSATKKRKMDKDVLDVDAEVDVIGP